MTSARRVVPALTLVVAIAHGANAQTADDSSRATARRLATAGVDAFQQNDHATAVAKLEKAYEMLPAPSIGLWLGRALAKQGKLIAACERYVEVGRLSVSQGDAAVQEQAQKEAAAELEALSPTIPVLTLTLAGATAAEVALSVDGASRPTAILGEEQPLDPGSHRIEARRGAEVVAMDVSLAPSEKKSVALQFRGQESRTTTDTRKGSAPIQRYGGWAAVGLGAVGLGVGGYFILHGQTKGDDAQATKQRFDQLCEASDPRCFDDAYEQRTNADLARLASDQRSAQRTGLILTLTGAALAVTGVVLVLTAKPAKEKPALALSPTLAPGLGMMALHGSFH